MIAQFMVKTFDPSPFLQNITTGRSQITLTKGDFVFQQDHPADAIYFLHDGALMESMTSDHGKFGVLRMIDPGTFFGTVSLENGTRWATTVEAMTTSDITVVKTRAMKKALAKDAAFAKLFTDNMVYANARLESEKAELMFNSVQLRLAKRLLALSRIADGEPKPIGREITQETLSDMIGTTRPRVNLFLNRFRKLELIDYDRQGSITVRRTLLSAVLEDSDVFRSED